MRFAVVGVIGAIVDFGVMNLAVGVFKTSLVVGGTLSFIAAIISNFTWNRYWTYPDSRTKPILRQLTEFSIVSIIGLGIRIPTLKILGPAIFTLLLSLPFQFPILSPKLLGDNLTLAVAVIIVMFWNFFVNRYWTYSDVEG